MRKSDSIRIAFFSLLENPLRTTLTLSGIAIGVTAVIFVVSVIEGLNRQIATSLNDDLGSNVFVIHKYGILTSHQDWVRARRRNPNLTELDAHALRRALPGVNHVGLSHKRYGEVRFKEKELSAVAVFSASEQYMELLPFDTEAGRLPSPAEFRSGRQVCFIGNLIAEQLFASRDPLGQEIQLYGRRFRIVGIAEKRGSVLGQSKDNFVMIPLEAYQRIRGKNFSVAISIEVKDPAEIDEIIDKARVVLRSRHQLRFRDEDDFGIFTAQGLLDFWSDLTAMIFRVAVFVVSISLVVGGIVIMNIMLLSVVERTREIGIRKAIGARHKDIAQQFLYESAMLCTLGGLTGVLFGAIGCWLLQTFTPLPARFPLWAPVLAVAVTSAVGLFFGIQPARKAADLDPIEALRNETI